MSTNCVSDDFVIVNINMGIRNVTWGEINQSYNPAKGRYYLTITYKNGDNIFYYPNEVMARGMFSKIRDAMIQRKEIKDANNG